MDNNTKHRILFVCHGNICRSPMAEFVMKDLVKKVGLEDSFMIESAAMLLNSFFTRAACSALVTLR
ncbi:MAG: hypothetical protein IJ647_08100 [Prevotella sp.]|nr:hypothetical protein [Prevotella sp.]